MNGAAASLPDGEPAVDGAGVRRLPAAEPEWNRVHPVSPLVRGWIALAALAYVVGRDQAEGWFSGDGVKLPQGQALFWTLALLGVVLLAISVAFFLSWWFTRYQLTSDHIRVHSGVIFRRQRQARLDRVQAIDIVQPLLARIFGLAELRFEVADAGESAVRLAYLKLSDAQALRGRILKGASGALESPGESAGEMRENKDGTPDTVPGEREVLVLPAGRVIGSALLSGTTVFLLLAIAAVVVLTVTTGEAGSIAAMIPVIFGFGSAYWGLFSSSFNFRASVSRDGIRIRSGLLDTRAQTVPPGRIQAVAVRQSPLWRITGWYSVSVNVAGYGAARNGDAQARTRLLPVGTEEEVFRMLALVLPDPGTRDPLSVFTAGMRGSGTDSGFTVSPRRARWLSPLSRRRNGYLVTETALLSRHGFLWRSLEVVPHSRTQSLALEQGPVARRLELADLVLHSTPGPVSPRVVELDAALARQLLDGQAFRARTARRRDLPEQWLRKTAPSPARPAPAGSFEAPPAAPPQPLSPAVSQEEPPHEPR